MTLFVARQPIFDRRKIVYAYELLFRSGLENVFRADNPDQATSRILADGGLLAGLESLTNGKPAFINFTRETLIQDYARLFPKEQIVVEILETVTPDEETLTVCRNLKASGYTLALDDFVLSDEMEPLLDLADIVKVDFRSTTLEQREAIVLKGQNRKLRFLAEKVETWEDCEEALRLGYSLLQGYFFGKPQMLERRSMPSFKMQSLGLIHEIHRAQMDFSRMEAIIKREVGLSYRLLRFINSAYFGFRSEIRSIRQALTLLGEDALRKWTSLILMADLGRDKPEETLMQLAVRAKFCESLETPDQFSGRGGDLFLMGLFSGLDALIDMPLEEALAEIPLAEEVKDALLEKPGGLRPALEMAMAYERAEWDSVAEQSGKMGMDEMAAPRLYVEAVLWGRHSHWDG